MRGLRQTIGEGVGGSQWARKAWRSKNNSEEGTMKLEGLGGSLTASQVQGESRYHDRLSRSWRD